MNKDEEIAMLKAKLYEIENTVDSDLNNIAEESKRIIKESGIPMTVVDRWEMYPPKSVADLQDHYPYTVTNTDAAWIWASALLPVCLVLILVWAIALSGL